MVEKIKRKLQAVFMDVTPAAEPGSETYEIVGINTTDLSISYNPQTNSEQDIVSDTAETEITGYQPTAAVTQQATKGDPVYEFINEMRKKRAVLADSYTTIVLVDLYDAAEAADGSFEAELQPVSIQIDSYGGAGGEPLSIGYTINFRGDSTLGTFDPKTKKFTPKEE